jgi:aminopeptidase N
LVLETNEHPSGCWDIPSIPAEFREEYETYDDKSYDSGNRFNNLWNNFPEYRIRYLDQSKNWIGYNDYNLRTLWLSLALSTEGYSTNKSALIEELINYSSTNYDITRQNALTKLIAFQLINDTVLKNLVMPQPIICGSFLNLGETAFGPGETQK